MEIEEEGKQPFNLAFIWPVAFLALMWVVELLEFTNGVQYGIDFGLRPRTVEGLIGIIASPFIHSDWNHLINNSVPIIVLGLGIAHFYKELAWKIFLWSMLITGLWVWVGARDSVHIGASGVVYAWASFIFFSGVLRKNKTLLALSLLVILLYGGMVWGVLPIKKGISWESHLFGGIAGIILAFNFRQVGPQKKVYSWEDEEEEEEVGEEIDWEDIPAPDSTHTSNPVKINYSYKQNTPTNSGPPQTGSNNE